MGLGKDAFNYIFWNLTLFFEIEFKSYMEKAFSLSSSFFLGMDFIDTLYTTSSCDAPSFQYAVFILF